MKIYVKYTSLLLLTLNLIGCNDIKITSPTLGKSIGPIQGMILKAWDETRPAFSDQHNPTLAQFSLNKSGDGLAIFVITRNINHSTHSFLYASSYENGKWTHPEETNFLGEFGSIEQLNFKFSDSGNGLIVLKDYHAYKSFSLSYNNGQWAAPETAIETSSYSILEQSSNGKAVILWQTYSPWDTYVRRYDPISGWAAPEKIAMRNGTGLGDRSDNTLSIDNAGNLRILSGVNDQLFLSQYQDNSWSFPADMTDHFAASYDRDVKPVMASNKDGKTIILWYESDFGYINAKYIDGNDWGAYSLTPQTPPDPYQNSLQVAISDEGHAILSWGDTEYLTYTYPIWSLKQTPDPILDVHLQNSAQLQYSLFTSSLTSANEYSCNSTSCSLKRNLFSDPASEELSISKVFYSNGTLLYKVERLKDCQFYTELVEINESNSPYFLTSRNDFACGS